MIQRLISFVEILTYVVVIPIRLVSFVLQVPAITVSWMIIAPLAFIDHWREEGLSEAKSYAREWPTQYRWAIRDLYNEAIIK